MPCYLFLAFAFCLGYVSRFSDVRRHGLEPCWDASTGDPSKRIKNKLFVILGCWYMSTRCENREPRNLNFQAPTVRQNWFTKDRATVKALELSTGAYHDDEQIDNIVALPAVWLPVVWNELSTCLQHPPKQVRKQNLIIGVSQYVQVVGCSGGG